VIKSEVKCKVDSVLRWREIFSFRRIITLRRIR